MTKKTKHTPGPWETAEYGREGEYFVRVVGNNLGHIATTTRQLPAPQCLANARLIAAAPELLEACKAALERIELECYGDTAAPWQLIQEMQSAIAKAEGSAI